jgi:hypothetical protein
MLTDTLLQQQRCRPLSQYNAHMLHMLLYLLKDDLKRF